MSRRDPGMMGRTVLLCFLASLCEGFDIQALGVSASGISSEFAPNSRLLGFIFSASTLGLLIGAFIGGSAADFLGRKTVLIACIASFGITSLLTAVVPDMTWLGYARFATGLGLGGALPSIMALGAEASHAASRRSAVAILYSGAPVGAALASFISLLVNATHWRWIFIVGGIMPLILAPLIAALMAESALFRAVRIAQAVRSAQAARTLSPGKNPDPMRALLSRIAAICSGRTMLLWIGFCFGLLTLYLLLNWLPTLLVARGLSHSQAAAAQIGFNVGGAIAILLISRMLDTRSRRAIIVVTFAAIPCVLALLALLSPQTLFLITATVLLGAAVLGSQSIVYALAPLIYPTQIRGEGLGAAVGMGRIGAIAGPIMVGLLLGTGRGANQVFLILVPLVIIAGLSMVWLDALTTDLSVETSDADRSAVIASNATHDAVDPAVSVNRDDERIPANSVDMGCIREAIRKC
jgi:AAHS family 3-hydroxyphenylpropionic acid transporter